MNSEAVKKALVQHIENDFVLRTDWFVRRLKTSCRLAGGMPAGMPAL